ncbi:ASCH domain-containing protein [Methanospirillum sp.]|uniref:ASCH domain-containing protein n=1 Tax=Methanospirillum sp. TaxID=45200 RepID=UPI0035A1550D
MDVLLSIKPEYVKRITRGEKKYEFRKKIFKSSDIGRIFIYSSSPEKKIIGSFRIGAILRDHPELLWDQVKEEAGIDYDAYCKYFSGKTEGYAIQINDLKILSIPIDPKEFDPCFTAPQSYQYLPKTYFLSIERFIV